MAEKLNFIDLFAGASGMSEGFINAGFNPISHVEMNPEACQTIRTRAAYHYLKSKNKLHIYHQYIKGEITQEVFLKTFQTKF
ncbi:MAG: DNA cytosine methyltransferase [Flavobacterium sp. JAD_PAG50586_2]|nr:MAG: DNA cytosine methyltransferase [Flavobacterium sp. JAD_PAG50586_2]